MFKQGYMIQITSWENDGDCYNTKTFNGLTEDQARWLVRFCEQLAKVGQEPAHEVDFDSWNMPPYPDEDDYNDAGYLQDKAYDLVGCAYERDTLRVCDSWKVCYIPFDIPEIKF